MVLCFIIENFLTEKAGKQQFKIVVVGVFKFDFFHSSLFAYMYGSAYSVTDFLFKGYPVVNAYNAGRYRRNIFFKIYTFCKRLGLTYRKSFFYNRVGSARA